MIQKKTLILKTLKFFIEGLKKKSKNTSIRNIVKWSLTFRISHKTNYKNIAREVKKKKKKKNPSPFGVKKSIKNHISLNKYL